MPDKNQESMDSQLSDFGDMSEDPITARERETSASSLASVEALRLQMYFEKALSKAIDRMETNLDRKLKDSTREIKTFIKTAFPEEDLEAHKRAHETQIVSAKRWGELKSKFIEKAFTTGALAAVGFVVLALWETFKAEVKK